MMCQIQNRVVPYPVSYKKLKTKNVVVSRLKTSRTIFNDVSILEA